MFSALIDTGATLSGIDRQLAKQLDLPTIDRRQIAGVHGIAETDVCLAQLYIPALNKVVIGDFIVVDLAAGGQRDVVLLGRDFLRTYTMIYNGREGIVTISDD